jgi:ankyrin repeat protein
MKVAVSLACLLLMSTIASAQETKSAKLLERAARDGRVDTVRQLLAAGAGILVTDPKDHWPAIVALVAAVQSPSEHALEIANLLMASGAGVNSHDVMGNPVLFYALMNKNPEKTDVLQALVAAGADIHGKAGITRVTPLMVAAESGDSLTFVKLLLRAGARADIKDSSGSSALVHASRSKGSQALQIVKELLSAGREQAQLDRALVEATAEIIRVLRSSGAKEKEND